MSGKPWWEKNPFFKGAGREPTLTDIFMYQIYDSLDQATVELSRELSLSEGQIKEMMGIRLRMYAAKRSIPPLPPVAQPSPLQIAEAKKDLYQFLTNDLR